MQQVKNLVPSALEARPPIVAPLTPRSADPETAAVINKLFVELQCIFPAWRQAWPDERALNAAKRSWVKAFMGAGITTLEQIRFGLERSRLSGADFAPSAGKFIQWCQPTTESLGLPSTEQAYRQACANSHPAANRKWLHCVVEHAACRLGLSKLANQPEEVSRRAFERHYAEAVRLFSAGEKLLSVPLALPDPHASSGVRTAEGGAKGLAALRAALAGGAHA